MSAFPSSPQKHLAFLGRAACHPELSQEQAEDLVACFAKHGQAAEVHLRILLQFFPLQRCGWEAATLSIPGTLLQVISASAICQTQVSVEGLEVGWRVSF